MQTPREIELKLECDGPDLTALAGHPLLQAEAAETAMLDTTYLDTAARDLDAAGLSLRLRREGERTIQTLKSASPSAIGLFDRAEWEWDVAGPEIDLTRLADTPAASVLAEAEDPALAPLFRTMVERSRRPIRYGKARIVATLDLGRVETVNGDVPLCEAELELEDGDPADLFALAKALSADAPFRLGVLSKGERGYALAAGRLRKPSKAAPLALDTDISAGEAFVAIAKGCLRHLRLNEDVFRHGRAPEALHQMRVALRRLRSAFTLFKPMLQHDEAAQRLRDAVKRVTEPFGTARNLDVFLGETLAAEIERRPDERGLHDLKERLGAEREAAYAAVFAILDGADWRILLVDLVTWIEAGDWRRGKGAPGRDRSARDFAASVLERLRRRVKKRGRHLARLEPEERHRVRIEAKKLRYGAEFFGPLFPERKAAKRHKGFVGALSDLQDHLGGLNDLSTAHEIADRLLTASEGDAGPPSGAALFAAGLTAADAEAEARAGALVEKADAAHESLVEVRPFWR